MPCDEKDAAKKEAYLHDPDVTVSTLYNGKPYQRNIDLSKFYDFSKPGSYEVQLIHSDYQVVKRGGEFCSGVTQVAITE